VSGWWKNESRNVAFINRASACGSPLTACAASANGSHTAANAMSTTGEWIHFGWFRAAVCHATGQS
jgi:hypothetical protein